MIVLESGDKIRGDATNASEVDFTIHGLDNNALKQLADGQLANSIGDIYTADSTDVVTAIILVNTGAGTNAVNLYLTPAAGTARRLIPKDLTLSAGYSLHFEGGKMVVLNTSGQIIYVGATGAKGDTGAVLDAVAWNGNDMRFTLTDASTVDLANAKVDLKGDTGATGAAGDMTNPMTAAGDIIYGGVDGAPTKLVKGTAAQALVMNSGATAPEWGTVASGLPLGYITGLTIAHAADTEHDITVAAGKARDATDAADMVLASAITKQFDAAWSVGSAAGGFAAGESLPASGTIHIWLIKRADTGVVDVMANNHATTGLTPTLPADYDYKRRIFSLRTDASNNIINGDQWGTGLNRTWMYDTPILDYSSGATGTNAVTVALSTPGGIIIESIVNIAVGASGNLYLSSLNNADMAPSITLAPLTTSQYGQAFVYTNTSSQIRLRNIANVAAYIATLGWEDSL